MLAEERFSEILKLVNEHKTITVQELTELLDMSESTIRRDLTTLHKKGKLIKVHGGATAVNMAQYTRDESVAVRQDLNIDEKVQIGKYASSLIEKDDFVYIDAGTTTDFLIDFLTEQDAVYVTNGIMHAKKLTQKGCIVYLIGGELKEATLALVGEEAMKIPWEDTISQKDFSEPMGSYREWMHHTGISGRLQDQRDGNLKKRKGLHPCRFNQIRSGSTGNIFRTGCSGHHYNKA